MTSTELRALIEAHGQGTSFTQKLQNIAVRIHCGERTLWRQVQSEDEVTLRAAVMENLKAIAAAK